MQSTVERQQENIYVKGGAEGVRDGSYYQRESKIWLALGLLGILLGLAAPGYDQWYIAWFGLSPLIIAAICSRHVPEAFYRGTQFGFAFTLTYNAAALQFSDGVWPEVVDPYSWLANPLIWVLVGLQQGALCGTFCSVINWLPLKVGFLPGKIGGRLKLPALLTIPIVWVLIFNKLGNWMGSMGLPWAFLEYTQYDQKAFLQIAKLVGGIGISALIVMINVAIASLVLSVTRWNGWLSVCSQNLRSVITNALLAALLIGASIIYGHWQLNSKVPNVQQDNVAVLQGNILFSAQESNSRELFQKYKTLASQVPAGLCIWPEWAIPDYVSKKKPLFESVFGRVAKRLNQDWIVGTLDTDSSNRCFNAAFGVERSGMLADNIYHKRFMIPFGEYTPSWILKSPFGVLCGTLTPRREGYSSHDNGSIIELNGKKIAPLICCEFASPELAARGVREGAQLIVDCSNTSWFDPHFVGKQCIAVAIMRAVENHRAFAFSTTQGPSAIIDPNGIVMAEILPNTADSVSVRTNFHTNLTPFTRWFR